MPLVTLATYSGKHGAEIRIAHGSVLEYTSRQGAIVNAANEGCVTGGGIDGALNDLGGPALIQARKALPVQGPYAQANTFLCEGRAKKGWSVRCPTGSAVITTSGGQLPFPWVVHAVGPNYRMASSHDTADMLLYGAYAAAMEEGRKKALPDLAFCLLSAGIFRADRSLGDIIRIGCLAVQAHAYPGLETVTLVGFTQAEADALEGQAQIVFGGV